MLGERVEIMPNNAIPVINLHDQIYGVRNGAVEKDISVTTRGMRCQINNYYFSFINSYLFVPCRIRGHQLFMLTNCRGML